MDYHERLDKMDKPMRKTRKFELHPCTGCEIRKHAVCNLTVHTRYIRTALRDCPCGICLVKVMCREKCKGRIRYFKLIRDKSRQYIGMGGSHEE
jgi:hypothetical protein